MHSHTNAHIQPRTHTLFFRQAREETTAEKEERARLEGQMKEREGQLEGQMKDRRKKDEGRVAELRTQLETTTLSLVRKFI